MYVIFKNNPDKMSDHYNLFWQVDGTWSTNKTFAQQYATTASVTRQLRHLKDFIRNNTAGILEVTEYRTWGEIIH